MGSESVQDGQSAAARAAVDPYGRGDIRVPARLADRFADTLEAALRLQLGDFLPSRSLSHARAAGLGRLLALRDAIFPELGGQGIDRRIGVHDGGNHPSVAVLHELHWAVRHAVRLRHFGGSPAREGAVSAWSLPPPERSGGGRSTCFWAHPNGCGPRAFPWWTRSGGSSPWTWTGCPGGTGTRKSAWTAKACAPSASPFPG